jgi:chloramphenicol 3-O-phosphotransferase
MRLVFLHGAPAVGKLTVAKAILRLVSGRLFDNHAALDLALTVLDFGAPGFWELVHSARLAVLEAAASHDVPLIVMTYCYSEPEDRPAFEQFEAIVSRYGGELLPVFLTCAREENVRRLGNADRASRRKITSEVGLDRFLARSQLSPVPRADCLMLDTSIRSPDATAQEIVHRFGLATPQNDDPGLLLPPAQADPDAPPDGNSA